MNWFTPLILFLFYFIFLHRFSQTPDRHGALEPRTPGLRRPSCLSLLGSWDDRLTPPHLAPRAIFKYVCVCVCVYLM